MTRKKKTGQHKAGHTGTPALAALEAANVPFTLYEYEHSQTMEHGYAQDTAQILGIDPDTVFKTLMVESGKDAFIAIVPASARLNLKAVAHAAGVKSVAMMEPSRAEKVTGYVTGGISPLGQKHHFPIFLDESAVIADEILISGGKRSLSVGIAPADFIAVSGAQVADIAQW
ncbi:Cys-tRNA(Pro) deacylase [Arcanobacterium pinnipediorum]|uniref:Cys-tRNA(Pro)/Cys-tRNA(Cys) deacylase n=1 Tax=Arcanobacterium pinnipediorum TaxID=1503041 RepID=A0ABY5AII4_9ACTO|nr:Cys-tRNA(Pro) deacylase [Arcanobacterium pinnipediorum]USR79556.1 Cys-tRNA(Pro) deacylase [Arcanobacterium pinnipediorum]